MKITREWAMANSNTFQIAPIRNLIDKYLHNNSIDPFANSSKLANKTNDLNSEFDTDFHIDALDYLKMFYTESIDFVFYDPPYSLSQGSEWYTNHKTEIKRILKPSGIAMCFGWNSNGIGSNDMRMIELLIVAHGGQRHDTLVTVEKKQQGLLFR